MFDTHCHLNFEAFDNIVGATILNAREAGVKHFLIPGVNLADSKKAITIAADFSNVYAACGLHPTEDLEALDLEGEIFKVHELIRYSEKVQAVGEVGLDYYKYSTAPRVQKMFLRELIKLAVKFNKALILHNRHASQDILNILEKSWNSSLEGRCVFHCAEADENLLEFAIQNKVFLGVAGDVTHDLVKQHFIKKVPLDLLVIETDSPYQTPDPVRYEVRFPNEPKNLVHTARKVAELKNISLETLITATNNNAAELFDIKL